MPVYFRLAYSELEQFRETRDCYKRALELEPDNEGYARNLSIAEEKLASTPQQAANPLAGLCERPHFDLELAANLCLLVFSCYTMDSLLFSILFAEIRILIKMTDLFLFFSPWSKCICCCNVSTACNYTDLLQSCSIVMAGHFNNGVTGEGGELVHSSDINMLDSIPPLWSSGISCPFGIREWPLRLSDCLVDSSYLVCEPQTVVHVVDSPLGDS